MDSCTECFKPFFRLLYSRILERIADGPALLLDCTWNDRNSCFRRRNHREKEVGHEDGIETLLLRNETKRNEICTLRNENLYFAKWNLYFAKWKSVLCEMKVCTLRNENLYFGKWKSVLCEVKICTLRNEICTLQNENRDLKTWDRGHKENNFSELVCRELLRRN